MAEEQAQSSKADHLKAWQFQPGQSGNPAGRKPGSSLKDYAKKYLSGMTDEERLEFMRGIDKKVIWEMSEGKAEAKTESKLEVTLPQPLLNNVLENNSTAKDSETQEED